jgi:hypothetical protein
MIAEKQGDFTAKLSSILQQAGNINMSAINEYTWISTDGQVSYSFPITSTYSSNAKWLRVYVGGVPVDTSLVNNNFDSKFELLIDPVSIKAGTTVLAQWLEPIAPIVPTSYKVIPQQPTPPADAEEGDFWFDTSDDTYQGTIFEELDTKIKNLAVNVKDLGAKGDGTTDDTLAIQTALNTLPVNSVLFFPIGTYKITSQLTWDGTINLIGANRDSTIIKATSTFSTLLYKKDEWQLCGRITELTFDGNGLVDYVFDFPQGKGLRAFHNFFKNAKQSVVRFGGGATWGAYETHFYDNNLLGLENPVGPSANRPSYGLELGAQSSDSQFYDNIITNTKIAGILQAGTHNYVCNNHIYGYPIDYIPDYGIKITNYGNRTYYNRLDTPNISGVFCNRWGNSIESNHTFWHSSITNFTGKSGVVIDNTLGNVSNMICKNNFTEGASVQQDIILMGNVPDRSRINENVTNAINRFDDQWRGTISVPINATSVSLTFKYPMTNYNFIIKCSTNFASVIAIAGSLTGATFNIVTPVNWSGANLQWELTPV